MSADELCSMPAADLAALLHRRAVSAREVVTAHLDRIDERNDATNAYVTVLHGSALAAADRADDATARGEQTGPLHGVPVAIKDVFAFKKGVRATNGSRLFAEYVAADDALPVARLERAGAIVLGVTNACEFGHRATTDNLLFGPTSTPFAADHNAGGSSGGSAAAVADGLASLAQGSDGGGSIRIPAAMCGVVGFKASFGRVAEPFRANAFVAHTPFLHTGPLARTVRDAALALSVLAGPDARDPLCLPNDDNDFLAACEQPVQGLRAAYSPTFGGFPVDADVDHVVRQAVAGLRDAGIEVDEVDWTLPLAHEEVSDLWLRQASVVSQSIDAELAAGGMDLLDPAVRTQLTPEFASLVERGRRMTVKDVTHDAIVRTSIFDRLQDLFDDYDLLVTPTLSVAGVPNDPAGNTLGPSTVAGQTVDRTIGWCLTHPINFTGHPAVSLPAGLTARGLPVGLQIIARRHRDDVLLSASAAFESARPWHGLLQAVQSVPVRVPA